MIEQTTDVARFAAVDIGSNAIRYMVKTCEKQPNGVITSSVLIYLRVPIRLGEDVFVCQKVSARKVDQVIKMMKAIRHLNKLANVQLFRLCGTSALREARNGKKVINKVEEKTKCKIEIISGQEEASLLYINRQIENRDKLQMFVDVGGGSTEISLIQDGQVIESRSFRIGTVRMLFNATEEGTLEALKADVEELAKKYPNIQLVGSGGNIEKYYKLAEKKDNKNKTLGVSVLKSIYDDLKKMKVGERMEKYNLKRDRADVIVPAGEIFLSIAECIGAKDIHVPMYGLADGIVADLITQYWNLNH